MDTVTDRLSSAFKPYIFPATIHPTAAHHSATTIPLFSLLQIVALIPARAQKAFERMEPMPKA